MRSYHFFVIVAFLLLSSGDIYAITPLQADYRTLVERRQSLNQEDRSLVKKRKALDARGRQLNIEWARCAGGRWHVLWEPVDVRSRKAQQAFGIARGEVTKLNRRLGKIRRTLDAQRRELEIKYEGKRGKRYESDFRLHMAVLEDEYLRPFDEEYLHALRQYLNEVEQWQISIEDTIKACQKRELSAVIVEQISRRFEQIIESVGGIITTLRGK